MLTSFSFSLELYEKIKDMVPHGEPYVYIDDVYKKEWVEVDVQEDIFRKVVEKVGY
jgi:hypothetical protein